MMRHVFSVITVACMALQSQAQVQVQPSFSASVQDAISALPAGGGTLQFAPGDYVLADTVVIDRPVVFRCDPGVWFRMPKLGFMFSVRAGGVQFINAGFRCTETGHCVQVLGRDVPIDAAQHYRDWLFRDCRFDGTCLYLERVGRYTHDGKQQDSGTDIAGDVVIDRCTFTGAKTPAAILLAAINGCVIRDCVIRDCGIDANNGDAIKVTAGSQHVLITGTRIERPTRDGIDLFDSSRVTIAECVIRDCGAHGIDAKRGASTYNPTDYHTVRACLVERCTITGYSLDTDDASCIGCVAIECQDGFRNVAISGGKARVQRGVFLGNRAVRCSRNGFYFGGGDAYYENNIAVECGTSILITCVGAVAEGSK